ncbi:MAG: hypothetical protein ACI4JS_04435 [Oscillospiraceae bacterium]
MDIKAKIDEVVAKVKADPNFAQKFKTEPIKAVEEVLGVDLPDDIIQKIIDGVKAKIDLGGIADKIGGLFGR